MTPDDLTCSACRERLPWHVAGGLSPAEESAVERHLAGCAGCRREAAAWGSVATTLADEDNRIPSDSHNVDAWLALRGKLPSRSSLTLSHSTSAGHVEYDISSRAPASQQAITVSRPPRRPVVALLVAVMLVALSVALFSYMGVRLRHNQTPAYQSQVKYFWYTAQANDTIEGIAAKFNVQIGGIFELNNFLSAGQEITVGVAYKIPEDPNYGKNFRPAPYVPPSNGSTTFGNSPWTSMAGAPLPEALCGQYNGNGVPVAYHLVSPNPNSYWVRGFRWYHDGVDLSTTAGSPIHAAQAGEVIWAGWDFGGLGYSVKINDCYGISTVYGHMESLNIKVGDDIVAGMTIGLEGSTGWSTGPNLHFMVEVNNIPVDPAAYYGFNCDALTGSTHYATGASCD